MHVHVKRVFQALFHWAGLEVVHYPNRLSLGRQLVGLIAEREIDLAIDVGANVGQFGKMIRSSGYKGRLLSYEPVDTSFRQLQETAKGDREWRVHKSGLGSARATGSMNIMEGSVLNSLYTPSCYGRARFPNSAVVAQETVAIARLDQLVADEPWLRNSDRALLKIDTQGHDLAVLEGSRGILHTIQIIVIEMSVRPIYHGTPRLEDTMAALREAGFDLFDLFPTSHDNQGALIECDGLFVRR